MEFQQNLQQKQSLALTQSMRLSLEILQMSQGELAEKIQKELETNPLLEQTEPVEIPVMQEVYSWEERRQREEHYTSYLAFSSAGVEMLSGQEITFPEVLQKQLYELPLSPQETGICQYLIELLDGKGYLRQNTQEIAQDLKLSTEQVEQCVEILQSLEPVGVGARNLSECLLLQLQHQGKNTEKTEKLVREGLELMANQQFEELQVLLRCDEEELERLCNLIRSLHPIPSQGYPSEGLLGQQLVDAVVLFHGEVPEVQMNNCFLPPLWVNRSYEIQKDNISHETWEYCKSCMERGEKLITSLNRRNETVKRLIAYTAQVQSQFLLQGKPRKPLTMAEVAEGLQLHVSTVSRGMQGVYFSCNGRTIALRSLIVKSGGSGDGGETVDSIQAQIARLIQQEDKTAPLSDQKLLEKLQQYSMTLSRRTVAKYRSALGYPNATQRKRKP